MKTSQFYAASFGSAAAIGAVMLGTALVTLDNSAMAQGAPQTVNLVRVDVQKLSTGYRSSKVIGSTIVNDSNETIGKVDDVILTRDGSGPYAVLSVGGFLGLGDKLVAVPYTTLKAGEKHMILPGATKDSLKTLPEFKYAS